MKLNFLIISIVLLLISGCSAKNESISVTPICRHIAIMNAITWQDLTKQETAIVIGKTRNGINHAQAVVLDDNMLKSWLVFDGKEIKVGKREIASIYMIEDIETFSLKTKTGMYGKLTNRNR